MKGVTVGKGVHVDVCSLNQIGEDITLRNEAEFVSFGVSNQLV